MKGQIVEWNDSKGYGFISALEGEMKVFVHVSSVKNTSNRPKLNDKVTFEVSEDAKGRFNAKNVVIRGANGFPVTVLFGFTFLSTACASVVVFDGEWVWIPLYLVTSIMTYLAFFLDKEAAKKGKWRTSENTLHLFSLVGGWPGALFAQFHLRHKSRKQPFKFILWMTIALNIGAFSWSFTSEGQQILQDVLGKF